MKPIISKLSLVMLVFFTCSLSVMYAQHPFTVVIDAGHGGHDSGATGKYSKEKNLNLSVALMLGDKIKQNYPDVKVVYTRKTDIFLTLQERADIVNNHKADIFFCIHTNATGDTSTTGTETFVLRASGERTQGNLEVAMRENSVILLEDDYQTRYQGFDPNSIDSYIMFEYMQDKYLDKSLQLANYIEQQFRKEDRKSRGVQQAGFWVLYKSACPSVLIEMGFISNRAEENYLNSKDGKESITNAIFNAFGVYKYNHDKKSRVKGANAPVNYNNENPQPKPTSKPDSDKVSQIRETVKYLDTTDAKITFRIQILASKKKLSSNDPELKGLRNHAYYREDGYFKYTYGEETEFENIEKIRRSIAKKFPYAYVIAFRGDKKISVKDALKSK